jgi:hypothetical protein
MKDAQETLDRLVPEPARISDWDAVLRAARTRRRPSGMQWAAATGLAAVVALLVVAPWRGSERVGILDKALAAVGDGPVLHLVLRNEQGGTLVDLETGEREPLYNESEMWIDPDRGFVSVSRFGGIVNDRYVAAPSDIEQPFAVAAADYREALESGRAQVAGAGVVDGIPVHWIQVQRELNAHEWAVEVGISKESYKPVYIRETRDGKPVESTGTRVLAAEQMPAGSGDFTPTPRPTRPQLSFGSPGRPIDRAEASAILDGRGAWLGDEFDGLPLARIGKLTLGSGDSRATGVSLVYAQSVSEEGTPKATPSIVIQQAVQSHPALARTIGKYGVPVGHVALTPGGHAYMRYEGNYVFIHAHAVPIERSDELALAAARALRPLSAGSGAGG